MQLAIFDATSINSVVGLRVV